MQIINTDLYTQQIKTFLRSRGIPPTNQRILIANQLLTKHQHITAEQLFNQLTNSHKRISKATVYNTLGLFVKKGLIREIIVDSSHSYYDSNLSAHNHFYNVDTGELSDIPSSEHDSLRGLDTSQLNLPEGTVFEQLELVVKVRNTPS